MSKFFEAPAYFRGVPQSVIIAVTKQVRKVPVYEECIDDLSHSNRIVPVYVMRLPVSRGEPSFILVLGNTVLPNRYHSKVGAAFAWRTFREKNFLTSIRDRNYQTENTRKVRSA